MVMYYIWKTKLASGEVNTKNREKKEKSTKKTLVLSKVFKSYHCSQALHGWVFLVHVELGQIVSHWTFVLELRAQPCPT